MRFYKSLLYRVSIIILTTTNTGKKGNCEMKYLIVIAVVLGLVTFGALNYHFIVVDGGLKMLKKSDMTLENTGAAIWPP